MLKNTYTAYGSVAKVFHWLIFLLVLCMIIVGFFMDDVSDKALRGQVYSIHKLTGLSILFLMLLRLLWTLINPKPATLFGTPFWQRAAERLVHFLLYAVLIAMPIAGWVGSVAAGYVPHLFGFYFNLPIQKSESVNHLAFEIHEILAYTIMVLVSIHVLAALYHYFFKKDEILQRMF